jgi:integrase
MAILSECPICKRKQSVANKLCKCGQDLDKAKRSKRCRFYIRWRLPKALRREGDSGQRQEFVGYAIEEARASDGKRAAQKKENPRVLEIAADNKTTFADLAGWYTGLQSVKKIKTYGRTQIMLKNFNSVFGKTLLGDIRKSDLEDYIEKRKKAGMQPSSIDLEIRIAKQMVYGAFNDDRISGHALKMFNRLDSKKLFKRGSNARGRTISIEEFLKLLDAADDFLKPIIEFAMNTGMRSESEILRLRWSRVKRKNGFIKEKQEDGTIEKNPTFGFIELRAEDTKEGKKKIIPINHHAARILDNTMRHVNHDFVFTYRNKAIRKLTHFIACCERAGIPYGYKTEGGLVFRDIRRTVKSNMLEAGVDEAYRDAILGHSKKGMDKFYIDIKPATITKAMQKYTAWLDGELQCVDLSVDKKNQF